MKDVRIFGRQVVDEKTIGQLYNCITDERQIGVAMAGASEQDPYGV